MGRVEAACENMIGVRLSTEPATYDRQKIRSDSRSGINIGASMEVVAKVGFFYEDPVRITAEDAEWSYRALQKGMIIIYDPGVWLSNFGWRDKEKWAEQYLHDALTYGEFYGKYFPKGELLILLRVLVQFALAFRRWLLGIMMGNDENAFKGKYYSLGLVLGILAGCLSQFQVDNS